MYRNERKDKEMMVISDSSDSIGIIEKLMKTFKIFKGLGKKDCRLNFYSFLCGQKEELVILIDRKNGSNDC